ncbi:MAG: hypothetical protein AAGE61_21345 [Pseudomonadota bacterium]
MVRLQRYLKVLASILALLAIVSAPVSAETRSFRFNGHQIDLTAPQHTAYEQALSRYPSLDACRKEAAVHSATRSVFGLLMDSREDALICLFRLFSSFDDPEVDIRTFLRDMKYEARTTDWCEVDGRLSKLGKTMTSTWSYWDFRPPWRETLFERVYRTLMTDGTFLHVEIDCDGRLAGLAFHDIE